MVVWCVLCGLTLLSVALVEGGWGRSVASIIIVLIAAVKSRLVILHYMEANRAARHWRFLYETWNFAVTATIVIGYLVSRGPITESASVGAKEAGTVNCTVTIPYSWTLATMSTDRVSLSYSISVAGSTSTTVLPNRNSTHGLGSISVPANGTTTTQTIRATI